MTVTTNLTEDNVLVIKLNGEFSIFFKEEVENLVIESAEKEVCKFVFDLSEVSYIDSSGLSVLILAGNTAHRSGHKVRIVSPTAQVKYVIDIARISRILDYQDSVDNAVESFEADVDLQ